MKRKHKNANDIKIFIEYLYQETWQTLFFLFNSVSFQVSRKVSLSSSKTHYYISISPFKPCLIHWKEKVGKRTCFTRSKNQKKKSKNNNNKCKATKKKCVWWRKWEGNIAPFVSNSNSEFVLRKKEENEKFCCM